MIEVKDQSPSHAVQKKKKKKEESNFLYKRSLTSSFVSYRIRAILYPDLNHSRPLIEKSPPPLPTF